ncbi:DsbA family protein [Aureimonas sp. Leaf324]|jgi:protein-disulfide isomerase|uniref:DsbA family protein n=1 Tax=Aureimonas sp. Leaf324 TaxID=1736336 RepID=UPI0006F6199A|nr:DsbA family protein [Aureimonas sp. Leaf324]KQQ91468.1 disulfide bond formation protein DsbA [Aureimonas sp. Leaf324]
MTHGPVFRRLALGRRVGAAAVLGASLLGSPALALDDAQTREIETIVRNYLIANPEVLLESMQALEAKRSAQAKAGQSETIASLRERLDASPAGTVAGNPQGDVTLVEFFDYNCGYCKRAASDLQVLLESDPKLKVVYKEIPVLGPASEAAARVSLAFRETKPDSYPQFQKTLLASRAQVDEARALEVAAQLGVQEATLRPLLGGQSVTAALNESAELATALGISGTPSYVIGDELVPGAVGADALAEKIANIRACGSASCSPTAN